MAILQQKLNRKNDSGTYDEIHLKTDATNVTLSPTDETLLSDEIRSLKSSVSNGKSLIASAITDKGVSTASDATFQTMASNISSLHVYDPTKLNFSYTGYYKERVGGVVEFLTSGKLTIYNDTIVDLFLVGGGGSGGSGTYKAFGTGNKNYIITASRGGGGGYTNTIKAVNIPTGEYDVIVGAGGSGIDGITDGVSGDEGIKGNDGGKTSILGYEVNGGLGGAIGDTLINGNGGSGGGDATFDDNSGYGGSDGNNGNNSGDNCGIGQGFTTREFGETTGKLYSGGGGGGRPARKLSNSTGDQGPSLTFGGEGGGGNGGIPDYVTSGVANTGGGGGSGIYYGKYKGASGGSGIVVMRIAR